MHLTTQSNPGPSTFEKKQLSVRLSILCRPSLSPSTSPVPTSLRSSRPATTSALRKRLTTPTTPSGGEAGQEVASSTHSNMITDAPATLASWPATRSSGPADMRFSGQRPSQRVRWSPQQPKAPKSSSVRDSSHLRTGPTSQGHGNTWHHMPRL